MISNYPRTPNPPTHINVVSYNSSCGPRNGSARSPNGAIGLVFVESGGESKVSECGGSPRFSTDSSPGLQLAGQADNAPTFALFCCARRKKGASWVFCGKKRRRIALFRLYHHNNTHSNDRRWAWNRWAEKFVWKLMKSGGLTADKIKNWVQKIGKAEEKKGRVKARF